MRISDWSSDVCSSDLGPATVRFELGGRSEQRLARDDIHVDTRTIFVEQLTRARRFRAILLGYAELLRCQSSDSFLGFALGHWVLHPGCERVAGSADIARLQQRVQPQDPECDPTDSMPNVDARESHVSDPSPSTSYSTQHQK